MDDETFHSYARSRPRVRQQILDRLAAGERLKHICRDAEMPCQESVTGWMRRDPEFARAVAEACEDREDWYRDQMLDLVIRAGPASQKALTRLTAPLSRQETRLRKRPGWKRRREGG